MKEVNINLKKVVPLISVTLIPLLSGGREARLGCKELLSETGLRHGADDEPAPRRVDHLGRRVGGYS